MYGAALAFEQCGEVAFAFSHTARPDAFMHKEPEPASPGEPSNGHTWEKSQSVIPELEASVPTGSLVRNAKSLATTNLLIL